MVSPSGHEAQCEQIMINMIPSSRSYPFFSKIRGDFSVFIIFGNSVKLSAYIFCGVLQFSSYIGAYIVLIFSTPTDSSFTGVSADCTKKKIVMIPRVILIILSLPMKNEDQCLGKR